MSAEVLDAEVVEEAPMELVIVTKGEVIKNNFPEFKERLEAIIGTINTDLKTDEDFNKSKSDVKMLKEMSGKLDEALDKVFKDFDTINEIREGVTGLKGFCSEKVKAITKLATDRRDQRKKELIDEGLCELTIVTPEFKKAVEDATYKKSSFDSMAKAIGLVVREKNTQVAECQKIIDEHIAEHGDGFVTDKNDLLVMSGEFLKATLRGRIEKERATKEAALLEQRAKEAEAEVAKAKAEAQKPEAPVADPTPEKPANVTEMPPPPKIGTIPVGSRGAPKAVSSPQLKTGDEREAYITLIEQSFAAARPARLAIQDSKLASAAKEFAVTAGRAWEIFKKNSSK